MMTYFDKFVKCSEFQIFDFIEVLIMMCFKILVVYFYFSCKEIKEVEGKNHILIVQITMDR